MPNRTSSSSARPRHRHGSQCSTIDRSRSPKECKSGYRINYVQRIRIEPTTAVDLSFERRSGLDQPTRQPPRCVSQAARRMATRRCSICSSASTFNARADASRDRRLTDPETGVASGWPEAAICVQDFDVQCVLQFTLINAAGCALHRHTSQVIHRLEWSQRISLLDRF